MQPLVSVIVPIYNVEAYLLRCVNSIKEQTYNNLEIILVDDGSPDNCGRICDELAKTDGRILVIHKENGGLSDARNRGLDAATGEYIVFVDSDDYIAPSFIMTLYHHLIETDSDVALCSYMVVTGEDISKIQDEKPQTYVYNRKELLMNLYDANHEDATFFIVAWNKLYKRSLWDQVRFPKGKIHEDEATTYRIFHLCRRGVYVKVPLYGYFSSESSITRDAFSVKRLQWMDALNDRIAFFEKKKEPRLVGCSMKARADGAIHYYYPLSQLDGKTGQYRREMKQLKSYVREALNANQKFRNLTLSNKIGYRIFLISPALYKYIHSGGIGRNVKK